MIAPSPALQSAVAAMAPEDLKAWALQRLRGESTDPMIYQGKEPEQPHEAVTAAFRMGEQELADGKREALLEAMKDLHRELFRAILEKTAGENEVARARRWAEVAELTKPKALSSYASSLLHACIFNADQMKLALAQIAAAANALSDEDSTAKNSALLWRWLLDFPETAALAYRRLIPTFSFQEGTKVWIELMQHRLQDEWPTNVRLLAGTFLDSKEANASDIEYFATVIDRAGLALNAHIELQSSKNAKVADVVRKLEELAVRAKFERNPGKILANIMAQIERMKSQQGDMESSISERVLNSPIKHINATYDSLTSRISQEWIDKYRERDRNLSAEFVMPTFIDTHRARDVVELESPVPETSYTIIWNTSSHLPRSDRAHSYPGGEFKFDVASESRHKILDLKI